MVTRRRLLASLASLPLLQLSQPIRPLLAATLHSSTGFSFERLSAMARALAESPYQPPPTVQAAALDRIDYDLIQQIRFRPEKALWAGTDSPFKVQFFHLHSGVRQPVRIFVVENGQERELAYSPDTFDYGRTGLQSELPANLGFAGFRVMNPDGKTDWLAFQGASYFRTAGAQNQYGLSARGIAIDTALPGRQEEFPLFTAFWLERPASGSDTLRIHALLEGPSLTGAYRFDCRQGNGQVMAVRAELFPRTAIERLGVAPLTSMFWYGENNRYDAIDWRPEVHDSDGLALWTGSGERIWRPLINPRRVETSSFVDHSPRGFGLLQRDRAFDHYQDDSAFYEKRPSLWVEPLGDWGEGAVQLVEIPTDDEIHDNIVAYWVPARPVAGGERLRFDYRLHWLAGEPYPSAAVGRVVATRIGRGGVPGQPHSRAPSLYKFAIDFTGGPLAALAQRYDVEMVVTASRGEIVNPYALKVVGTENWRGVFDIDLPDNELVELRAYLRLDGRPLTETWLYRFLPPAAR